MSFASPTAALAQIVDCLDGLAARVHVGSRDSGVGLDCECDGGLLRVEEGGAHPTDPTRRSLGLPGCRAVTLDVIVVYRTCIRTIDDDGNSPPLETMTEQGTAITLTWWDALTRLSCCKPHNQSLRLIQVITDPPAGGCAGWTMNLEADLSFCDPCVT